MNALETSRAGFIYLALGDLDKFFEYMFRAADEHALQGTMFRYSPMFEKVRKDLRVAEVFSRAGLTWNWASTNGWRNRGSNPYGG